MGGVSGGEVTLVEVVEGGEENLTSFRQENVPTACFPVAIDVLKKADQAETLTEVICYLL